MFTPAMPTGSIGGSSAASSAASSANSMMARLQVLSPIARSGGLALRLMREWMHGLMVVLLAGVLSGFLVADPALAQSGSEGSSRTPPASARSGSKTMGDLTRFNTSIVRIDTRIPDDARSAPASSWTTKPS